MGRGIVTCERKNFHPGKVVAGFILGSESLYDFVHDNAMIEWHGEAEEAGVVAVKAGQGPGRSSGRRMPSAQVGEYADLGRPSVDFRVV